MRLCVRASYLQQFKGSQQFPGCAVASVNLVVLQLWGEPRGAVVLIAHLDGGLRKRPTYELCLTLNVTMWQQAVKIVRWNRGWELDGGVLGAVHKMATWCQYG